MRVVAISALFLLALAAVAVTPTSSAMQIPPPCQYCAPHCPGLDTIGPITAAVRIVVGDDCTVHVILLQAVACSHPLDGEWTVNEGRVSVTAPCKPNYGYCEPPMECAPEAAPAAQQPCCGPPEPSPCAAVGDPFTVAHVSDSCRTVSIDVINCLWGEQWNTVTAGPVTVRYTTCSPAPTQTASVPPPCACPPPQPLCYQVVRALAENQYYSLSDYCDIVVTLKADCGLQGSPEDHQVKAPKLTLNVQTCKYTPPPQAMAPIDPFPTCIRDCSPLPDSACALRDATPDELQHPLWGYDCTLDVETSCVNGYGSGHTETRVAFVNVDLETCGGTPPPIWS